MAVVPGRARPLFPSRRTTRREPQGGGALDGQHALQPCPNTITARSAGKRKEKRKEKKEDLSLYVVERRETIAVCTLVIECRQALCACATASAAHAPPHGPLPLRPLQLTRSKGALNHIYFAIIGASVSEPPQRTRCHDIYYIRSNVHRYCACAALRANVAGRIGNRVSPAESAFSACIGSGSSQT